MKTDLTIHAVVKNEPFLYYAIKSVYNYCDQILLYDTGSTDHTLEDIETLLAEDVDNKIIFKQIPLDFDEEKWSLDNLQGFIREHYGKMSVGKVRQMQINDTKTKYFMLVDGDEVHYQLGMKRAMELITNFPPDKYAIGLPLLWFYDLHSTFTALTFPYNGRVFVTDMVYMNGDSPNEQHVIKGINEIFTYEHPNYLIYKETVPYAHFETVFRPWRRKAKVPLDNVSPFIGHLPEVTRSNPYYIDRWRAKQ
jgi:glycosyltransferase involved in cell wall biosynthesis